MFEKKQPSSGDTRRTGAASRRTETIRWSRSRRRAAAYAAGVDHLQGVMSLRTR